MRVALLTLAASLLIAEAPAAVPAPDSDPLATTQWVPTADGAEVALHHHPGRGQPVLLVHGISSNHRFFDLDAEHNLADWLRDAGWDVWMLDLRGHGDAERREDGRLQRQGWTVDDYGRYDVPAAVDRIRTLTGATQVAYLGHSMGGMVGAIWLQTAAAPPVSAFVALGAPVAFSREDPLVPMAEAGLAAGGATLVRVPSPFFARLAATLGPLVPGRVQERLYNRDHLDAPTTRAMLRNVVSPLSRREMQQFARMIHRGSFSSFDGDRDWLAGLADVRVPTLVIAGGADEVARPARVHPWTEALGGESKWMLAEGYGHLDLALGEDAERDVFPAIGAWLAAHPPAAR